MSFLDWWAILGPPAMLVIGMTIGILTAGSDAYEHGYLTGRDDQRAELAAGPGQGDDLMAVADAVSEPDPPSLSFRLTLPVELPAGWRERTAAELSPEALAAAGNTGRDDRPAVTPSSTLPGAGGELEERRAGTAEHGAILDYTRMTWPEQQFVQVWGWARRLETESIEGWARNVLAQPMPWETAAA